MTKDEFLATLLLAGNTATDEPARTFGKHGLVSDHRIELPSMTGWIRFRPRDRNTLDLLVNETRFVVQWGKRKELLKIIIQLIEENNHGVG